MNVDTGEFRAIRADVADLRAQAGQNTAHIGAMFEALRRTYAAAGMAVPADLIPPRLRLLPGGGEPGRHRASRRLRLLQGGRP
jgi:hypothetical protein